MLDNLRNGGFCFLRQHGENGAIYENKFTGLWLLVDFNTNTYKVMEE